MSIAGQLNEKWQMVDTCLEKLVSTGAYANDSAEIVSLRDELVSLRSKRYTIAVCGDAKSGKSTFLNALIFGDSVLPTFDTPLTAKLTFIKYTDKNSYATVEFLSETEWQGFQRDATASGNRQKLDAQLQKCQDAGANASKWIGHEAVTLANPADISDYVCDPLNAVRPGIYTPFVKSVSVFVNHPALKCLDIVDTPGLNDSNELNSTVTQQWVREAHAVVYILPVRGAAQSDVEFFKACFPASAAEARVLVQNKIDDFPGDYMSARRAIKEYGKREEFKVLRLFGPNEVICSYSGLYELIRKKVDAGLELNEEESWFRDKWENGDETERLPAGFKGDPDGLEKVLAEKLFANEGRVRVSMAVGKIRSLYSKAIEGIVEDMETAKLRAQDCLQDVPGLERRKKQYEEFEVGFRDMSDEFANKQYDVFNDQKEKLQREFEQAKERILSDVRMVAIECDGHDAQIRDRVPAKLRESKSKHFRALSSQVEEIRKSLRDSLEKLIADIKNKAATLGVNERIRKPGMMVDCDDEMSRMSNAIEVDGDELYDKVPWKIRQIFTGDSTESIADKIKDMVAKILDTNIGLCLEKIKNALKNKYNEGVARIVKDVGGWIQQRKVDCDEAIQKIDDAKKNKAKYDAEVESCKARIGTLNAALQDYDVFVGGLGVCSSRQA